VQERTVKLNVNDGSHMLSTKLVEQDNIIDSVQKLRREVASDAIHYLLPNGGRLDSVGQACQDIGTNVGCHDDNCVSKINLTALAIGQVALIENLKQQVGDFAVSFLELIKEDE
jgi:hypothetical protein